MGTKWIDTTIGDIVTLQRGHDLPSQDRNEGVVPIMGSSGLTGFHDEVKIKGPGVVIGRSGNSMGVVNYTQKDYWPLNTCLYVKDFKGNDERFIYYYLQGIDFDQFNSGSAQKSLNRNAVYPYQIKFPAELCEQKAIGEFLGSLENKIELNCQMNETLEQMAQALFKSWFVDFDPVIDNALDAGNPIPEALAVRAEQRKQLRATAEKGEAEVPALPDDIRSLFPSEFEFTEEMGWIPKEWEIDCLSSRVSILNGFAFKSKDYADEGTFVLRTKNFDANKVKRLEDDVNLPEIFLTSHEKYLCSAFDYHLVMVGASVGNRAIIYPHSLPALRNQNMWCFRTKNQNIVSQSFVKYVVDLVTERSLGLASGSAREFFRKGDFGDQFVCWGNETVQACFDSLCTKYLEKMGKLDSEAIRLQELRDLLLPKLISGELQIPEAEKLIAEALS
ncbi:restriction endonuclease subunit S [Pontibacterium sp. N1Y112]|uniref:Restriction endonuclease subunit S n=1 Tax=Pontibacterium sinense TaxID=2781979 RepID=A0A8J7FDX6_9GAMM|nr:restriction endonuclease subunit S [Pontibacterium sinense]MBE9397654.1 restriction endonuclease subunit S [Pontibacterium sinense]